MKLWEKIFICTLIIFEVFFVPSSIYLLNSSFKLSLNMEINSGINEQRRFSSTIQSDLVFLRIKKITMNYSYSLNEEETNSMLKSYLYNFKDEKIYLEVLDKNNNKIFDTLREEIPDSRPELNLNENQTKYIIRDINKSSYLFIASKINLENAYYKFIYIKDVSLIYNNRNQSMNTLVKLNIFVALALVIVMIILSKFIVKPIDRLIKSTQKIADGNFSERAAVTSDDEIGMLSQNFNHMAEVVEDKISELEKMSNDKQRFIDDLTHELRTPLTSIIGYADFLRTGQYDEETFLDSLTFIYKEGKRLEKLSENLMKLIGLRQERFTLKDESINALLAQVERTMLPKLKVKNIKLKINNKSISESIFMDIELMTILITNLIDNAIKASQHEDEIKLNLYNENENLIFEVKDNGIGIPKEEISKVCEPFYMVDKSRERANNGAGIGLSLCVEIAKIHKGYITIESNIKEGTSVKVIIKEEI